jgi:hypothetical protein
MINIIIIIKHAGCNENIKGGFEGALNLFVWKLRESFTERR